MEIQSKRFAGVLGKDIELFQLAVTHDFQKDVERFLRDFTSKINGNEKITILEGGTGTGITTAHILEADPRICVISVDNEDVVLNQAEENLKEDKLRIRFVNRDLLEFTKELDDESVDAFVSAWTIHNFTPEYRGKLFPETFRVLRKGGLFLNADKYGYENLKEHKKYFDKQIKAFDIYETIDRPDLKKEWTEHYIQDEQIKITDEEQLKILSDVGFEKPQIVFREDMEAIVTSLKPE
jgi:tRNA (cmo5U34)-methyltransferase